MANHVQKGTLLQAEVASIQEAYEEYLARFREIKSCEKKVEDAIKRYEDARAAHFLEHMWASGFNLCIVGKSKSCEKIVPISMLSYVYLRKKGGVPKKREKKVFGGESLLYRGQSSFRSGIYIVCSECLREMSTISPVFLEGEYFEAFAATRDENGFTFEGGARVPKKIPLFEYPLNPSALVPDKAIREIALPPPAHFFSRLDRGFHEDREPELTFSDLGDLFLKGERKKRQRFREVRRRMD